MYKALCVAALLLATFALTSGSKPADASASGLPSPVIIAKIALTGQTANIPATTIFTPTKTGLYRLSTYATETVPVFNSPASWGTNFLFTDDSGVQTTYSISWAAGSAGPAANISAIAIPFEAVAGQSLTFSNTLGGDDGRGGGTYSLYFTVERLE
jgi:hypothetical protein